MMRSVGSVGNCVLQKEICIFHRRALSVGFVHIYILFLQLHCTQQGTPALVYARCDVVIHSASINVSELEPELSVLIVYRTNLYLSLGS